jgi:hypothetical protein
VDPVLNYRNINPNFLQYKHKYNKLWKSNNGFYVFIRHQIKNEKKKKTRDGSTIPTNKLAIQKLKKEKGERESARIMMIYHSLILQKPLRETSKTLKTISFFADFLSRSFNFIFLFGVWNLLRARAYVAPLLFLYWRGKRWSHNRVWRSRMNEKKNVMTWTWF